MRVESSATFFGRRELLTDGGSLLAGKSSPSLRLQMRTSDAATSRLEFVPFVSWRRSARQDGPEKCAFENGSLLCPK